MTDQEIKKELAGQVRALLSRQLQIGDEQVYYRIDEVILEFCKGYPLSLKQKHRLRLELFYSFRRFAVLQKAIDNPDITEIMVNGAGCIFVEEKGVVRRWTEQFESEEQLEDMIQQMVSEVNRRVNVSSPIVDARLADGSRVHIVLPPVSLEGPAVTIRKFPQAFTMAQLVELEVLSSQAAQFLKALVEAGYNIFISGGTNSGKTTFLNALSAYIPSDERVITIEDSAELQIQQIQNLVRLETKTSNEGGEGAIGIGELIRASLRMNPDRIIIGEVRGKEAVELLNSFNTGHDGGMSSGHGNSPEDMLARLETMVLTGSDIPLQAVRSQIAAALDIMIHIGRLRDHSRRVLEIVEVGKCENGEISIYPLYQFKEQKKTNRSQAVEGHLEMVGTLKNEEKLRRSGLI